MSASVDPDPAEGNVEERGGSSVPARGTIQLLLARLAFVGIGFLVSVVLGRSMGEVAYGVYGVCLSLVVFLEMASNSGLQAATARSIQDAGGDPDVLAATSKLVHTLVSLGVFLVVFLFAPLLAGWLRMEQGAALLRLAVLDLPIAGLYFSYQGVLSGGRRFGTLALGLALYALTKLVGVLVLVWLGVSIEGALVVNIVATVGGIAWFFGRAGASPRAARPSLTLATKLLRLSVPMGFYLIVSQSLLSLDLWLLKAWGGAGQEVGLYFAATNVARGLSVVPAALSGVVFSSLARALAHGDLGLARHHVRAGGRFSLLVLVPAAVFAAVHAEEIMLLVYRDRYAGSGRFLALLVFLFAIAGVLDNYAHALMAAGREKVVAWLIALGVPLAVVLDSWWIPRFGGEGAAGASLVAIALATLAAIFFTARHFGTFLPAYTLVRMLLATAAAAGLGWWIPTDGLLVLVELALLCVVYVLFLIALGEISRQDLRRVLPW